MIGTVDTQALIDMVAALGNYISEVDGLLDELSAAARECHDNLVEDSMGVDAANKTSVIVNRSKESLKKASRLRNTLQQHAVDLNEFKMMMYCLHK